MMKKLVLACALAVASVTVLAEDGATIDAEAFFASTLTGLDEQPLAMESFRGRPLVVNFWARWCGPCRDEIPQLIKLRGEQKADGIEVIGIAIENLDKLVAVRDFAKAYEMEYPLAIADKEGIPLMKALGNVQAGMPFAVYIGRDGQAIGSKLGVIQPGDLEEAARRLLD